MACIICGHPKAEDGSICRNVGLNCDQKRLDRIERGRNREFSHTIDSGKTYDDKLRDAELLNGEA